MGSLSIWHWIIVLVVVMVLFGGRGKISSLMGDFAHVLAKRAQHGWQLFRPDRDQRDDAYDDELAPTNVKHGLAPKRRNTRATCDNPGAVSPLRAGAAIRNVRLQRAVRLPS